MFIKTFLKTLSVTFKNVCRNNSPIVKKTFQFNALKTFVRRFFDTNLFETFPKMYYVWWAVASLTFKE